MGCESSKRLDTLQDAIRRDDDEALRRLIREGANVNVYFRNGHHPLREAMILDKINCFKALLEAGADANRWHQEGLALTYADWVTRPTHVWSIRPRFAGMLVRAGADMSRCDLSGISAVALAARWGDSVVLEWMLRAGADINRKDEKGFTPVLAVVLDELDRDNKSYEDHFTCVRLLLEAGADVNVRHIHSAALFREESPGRAIGRPGVMHGGSPGGLNGSPGMLHGTPGFTVSIRRKLLYVAGDEAGIRRPGFTARNVYTQDPGRRLSLKHLCRVVIRRRLMQLSRVNLFYKAQRLHLPKPLQRYLVYNVSLNAEDATEALHATEEIDGPLS